jgi:hypothetical protein
MTWPLAAVLATCLLFQAARIAAAHELWIKTADEATPARLRIYFSDTPEPGEPERLSDAKGSRVWSDGMPLKFTQAQDALNVELGDRRPKVVSAFYDRGVVTSKGRSFIIYCAAYAQSGPLESGEKAETGIEAGQLHLTLIRDEGGKPSIKALWRGKPAADLALKVFQGAEELSEVRTNAQGMVPCPEVTDGQLALYAQLVDKAPGRRDRQEYSEVRYKATFCLLP